MIFSSVIFIFFFLPIVLTLYFLLRREFRNCFLLLANLLFYFWTEGQYTLLILVSILANYFFGLLIEKFNRGQGTKKTVRIILGAAVIFNVGLLVFFKYVKFLTDNLNQMIGLFKIAPVLDPDIHLPLGLSFFTFQAISYVVDIYRKEVLAAQNIISFGMYKSLFPQIIAGPIIRYRDVVDKIESREVSSEQFIEGFRRFVIGLGKKVLIANTVAAVADPIFALPPDQLTLGLSWLGLVCYTLQIYFDFSAYSDMAIGLGQMFGFKFLENFNYPYIAKSIQDFWQRWHISLSTWFRDYVYIPLGGNRVSVSRTYINLLIVFFLCGLWHGANWKFIFWGLWHGLFIILERLQGGKWLQRAWIPLRHLYCLLIVMIGWVFFRAHDFSHALSYLQSMAGLGTSPPGSLSPAVWQIKLLFTPKLFGAILLGALGSFPLCPSLHLWLHKLIDTRKWTIGKGVTTGYHFLKALTVLAIFILSAMFIASGTHRAFIYFRF